MFSWCCRSQSFKFGQSCARCTAQVMYILQVVPTVSVPICLQLSFQYYGQRIEYPVQERHISSPVFVSSIKISSALFLRIILCD
jgi:hypothetical protein